MRDRILALFFAMLVQLCYSQADRTAEIQRLINNAKKGSVVDGQNKTFYVTSLWLKSDMTLRNFKFISLPTSESDVSILNIGNDLSTNRFNSSGEAKQAFSASQYAPGIQNIIIENVTIDGNRKNHTAREIRDGGKHGISIKGFNNNIHIKNVNVKNCVTDGIAIYRGLHTSLEHEAFATRNIVLDNIIASNNRRHGGSGDSIQNFLCKNSTFNNNGRDSAGNMSGAKGAVFSNAPYGNGWDMEGYGLGSPLQNIVFHNCTFLDNAASGLLFYDTVDQNVPHFLPRNNIKISNSRLNAGFRNPSGNYALIFTSSIENKKSARKLYSNISVTNSILYGKLLLRSAENITLTDVQINSGEPLEGLIDYTDNVRSYNGTNRKTINWEIYNGKSIQ